MLGIMIDKYAGDHKTTQILGFLCKEYIGTFKSTQQPKGQESLNDKEAFPELHCIVEPGRLVYSTKLSNEVSSSS